MRRGDIYSRATRVGACLIWQGAIKSNGYGNVVVDGRTWLAHRLSYTLANGPIPAGLRVLHSCDVRPCIEPRHLHVGTAKLNSREMVQRGRYRGPARLSPLERSRVLEAVASGEARREVARQWRISPATVDNIVLGKHTALGDARWAMRMYDAVMAGGPA